MTAKKCMPIRGAPELVLRLVRDAKEPLSQQVYEQIRRLIVNKLLEQGDSLPPTRTLADQLEVSRTVVVQAYERLQTEGYISGVLGSGTFVSQRAVQMTDQHVRGLGDVPRPLFRVKELLSVRPTIPPPEGDHRIRYDFRHGIPAWDHFPMVCWSKLMTKVWMNAGSSTLGYGPAEGSPVLRREIARLLRHTRGIPASFEQIVITTGATQALSLLSTVLLTHGDIAVVEDPAHPVLRDIFRLAGADVVPVEVDDEGINVNAISSRVERRRLENCGGGDVRLVYVTPSHQFPSGVAMSEARKADLLAWVADHEAVVVEDDYDTEYRFEGMNSSALASLDLGGRVVYIGSFSKVLFPALRIGYAYVPRDLLEPFLTAKWLSDRLTPTLDQEILAKFIHQGHYAAHIRRMTRVYASRRVAMVDALRKEFGARVVFHGINAGLHLLIEIDSDASEEDISRSAASLSVKVYPASSYFLGSSPRAATFLLGFGGLSEMQIRAGIAALGRAERAASRSQMPHVN